VITEKSDNNFDDNRTDMERYVAAHTHRFEFTKHLQMWYFAALNELGGRRPSRTSNPPVASSNPADCTPKSRISIDVSLTTTKPVQNKRTYETTRQQLSAVEAIFDDIGGYLTDRAEP
jgi:hypothetical protein